MMETPSPAQKSRQGLSVSGESATPESASSRQEKDDARQQHFNLWSTVGINYTSINTPLSIGTYMAFSIGVGGSPVYIFGYIMAVSFQFLLCVSLAELAAAFPHSTGQVYWASAVAPGKWSRVFSYWVGAFTAAAWFFWTLGTYLFSAQLVLAMAMAGEPSYEAQPWHTYLCLLAGAAVGILLNIQLFKVYSAVMKAMMFVVNGGAVLVFVVLLVRAHPKRSAQAVFSHLTNTTGWASDGFVFLLGCLPGITAINGFDSATHVTDEIPDPARQVPRVMVLTSGLAALSGVPMVIVFMFCVINEANLLAPIGGQPIAQLFYDACDSTPLTLLLLFVYVFTFYVACGCLTTTFSRVLWSLARQRHIFVESWLSILRGRHALPENAIYFSALLASCVGLLCLGPPTALNAILGSAAVCFFISYLIPLLCVLCDRSTLTSQPHTMNLGRFGYAMNLVVVLWMVLMTVVLLFPQYLPVTGDTMNYTVAVVAAVVLVYGANWWFYARFYYENPKAVVY